MRGRVDLAEQHVVAPGYMPDQRPAAAADVEQRHRDQVHGVGSEAASRSRDPASAVNRLLFVSITPFGSPVVPDV